MAQGATALKAAAVETKVKRFTQAARFVGGDGAKVTIYLRENKKGAFNLGTTFKEAGAKKAVTGCTDTKATLAEAQAAFNTLVAVAVAHGWTKKEKKVRVPKAPAFTEATFPTAKPMVAGGGLAFPKHISKGNKK